MSRLTNVCGDGLVLALRLVVRSVTLQGSKSVSANRTGVELLNTDMPSTPMGIFFSFFLSFSLSFFLFFFFSFFFFLFSFSFSFFFFKRHCPGTTLLVDWV